jgi:hypothetical protein
VPLLLRVSGRSDIPQSAISYSGPRQPFAGIGSLPDALSSLTGLFTEGAESDTYRAARGHSVVDLIEDQLQTLQGFDMSAVDRQKLEAWKELLHETGSAAVSACSQASATSLGLSGGNDPAELASGDMTAKVAGELDLVDLFSNVAVLTALCDQNRVIFLKYPGSYVFNGLGIPIDSDSLGHRGTPGFGNDCPQNVSGMIATIDRYYAEKFAHLVEQLDSLDEGSGTLLDNSAAVWFQEFSDGCAGNLNNMPILQAGSCGGYFKTGQAINVDDGDPNLTRGGSEAICATGSFTSQEFKLAGTPVDLANAPINKYFMQPDERHRRQSRPRRLPAVRG